MIEESGLESSDGSDVDLEDSGHNIAVNPVNQQPISDDRDCSSAWNSLRLNLVRVKYYFNLMFRFVLW